MKALITGCTGQTGSFLVELLLSKGYEVHGTTRRSSTVGHSRIDHLKDNQNLFLYYADLTDGGSITNLLSLIRPDEIYNLAAQSHVGVSFEQPIYTVNVDALGTLRLLEAAKNLDKDVKFYQASSSEMFGSAPPPQNEETRFHPRSPYACAKLYSYWQTVNYREAYGMFACNGLLFNHESERRGTGFVTRKITKAAARISLGLQNELRLGNLDAKRDWGYAKDYAEAMWMMLQHDKADDYVIATGKAYSVRDWLDIVFGMLDLNWKDYVKVDPKFFRPAEVNHLCGDASKAKKILGWEPKTDISKLAEIMLQNDVRVETQKMKAA